MPRMPFNTLCCRPLVQLSHPREVVRQFTPNWFAVTMGTGILSAALPHLGLPGAALLGQTLWLLNLLNHRAWVDIIHSVWVAPTRPPSRVKAIIFFGLLVRHNHSIHDGLPIPVLS